LGDQALWNPTGLLYALAMPPFGFAARLKIHVDSLKMKRQPSHWNENYKKNVFWGWKAM